MMRLVRAALRNKRAGNSCASGGGSGLTAELKAKLHQR
jgi:hypothetical protein